MAIIMMWPWPWQHPGGWSGGDGRHCDMAVATVACWRRRSRVWHRYGNTSGFQAAGCAGMDTVFETPTHGYTISVPTVSRVSMGIE